MLRVRQILVPALLVGLFSLGACGQKGNLYLPSDPAAAGRASLPQAIGASVGTSIRSVLPQDGVSAPSK